MSILVVEDDTPSANFLASLCESLGNRTEIAPTMHEALMKLYGKTQYRIVFLDLTLMDSAPHDSLEAVEKMKRWARVVIVTGNDSPELKSKAISSGADGWVEKNDPLFPDRIRETLDLLR